MAWNSPGDEQRAKAPQPGQPGNTRLPQLLRRLGQRLQKLGGGGPAGPLLLALLLIVLAAGIWLGMGFYQLEAGEQGLVQRFGRIDRLVGSGFGWHAPWPIETMTRVDVGHIQSVDLQPHLLSADASVVNVSATLQYQYTDPIKALSGLRAPEAALRAAGASALQLMVGHSNLGNVLSGTGRDSLTRGALSLTQSAIDAAGGGVRVLAINITDVQLPDPVVPDEREVSKALEDQSRMAAEAQGYANDVLPRARAEADRLLQEAATAKSQSIAAAESDIAHFEQLAIAYAQAPEVTRNQLYISTMESIYSRSNKVIIDGKGGANNLLYLPLEKLLPAASASSQPQPGTNGSAVGAASSSASAPSGESAARGSEDDLRGRDRDDR